MRGAANVYISPRRQIDAEIAAVFEEITVVAIHIERANVQNEAFSKTIGEPPFHRVAEVLLLTVGHRSHCLPCRFGKGIAQKLCKARNFVNYR